MQQERPPALTHPVLRRHPIDLLGVRTLPGSAQPSVRVVFPLPLGSVQIFLKPSAGEDGSFHLRSPIARFGADGAYLVLERKDATLNARRIPLNEHFHLYVDEDGDVRADHSLKLWNIPAVRLHYRMRRSVRVEAPVSAGTASAAGG